MLYGVDILGLFHDRPYDAIVYVTEMYNLAGDLKIWPKLPYFSVNKASFATGKVLGVL